MATSDPGGCSSHSRTDTLIQYMKGLSSRPKLVVLDIGKALHSINFIVIGLKLVLFSSSFLEEREEEEHLSKIIFR